MDTENKKPENTLAFPTLVYNQRTGEPNGHDSGMTIRDFFAAKVCNGFYSGVFSMNEVHGWSHEEIAKEAYQMADAMLKVREL